MYNYDKVPNELKKLNRWVLWKENKIPINAKTGYGAKSNDNTTWSSFDEAVANCEKYNCLGIGFMLGNGFFGVDIDHAIDNNELISEFENALLPNSYFETSQSGTGVHFICKGVLPVGGRRHNNIEMYDNVRYFALTGIANYCQKMEDKTDAIIPLWKKYIAQNSEKYVFRKNDNETYKLSNAEVIEKASSSTNGNLFNLLYYGQWEGIYKSQSDADLSFCSMLAFWCSRDKGQMDEIFRSSKLYRPKWDEKRGKDTYGEMTLQKAIEGCSSTYDANFNNQTQFYNPQTGEIVNVKKYDLTDTGNAERLVDRFGDNIKYNFDNKCWMVYDGKTWHKDTTQMVKKMCDLMIDEMKEEAIKCKDDAYSKSLWANIKRVASNSGKEALLKEAMHLKNVPCTNGDFNKQKYLLNCDNGIVDLENVELLKHDKKYLLSKNTNVSCDIENEPKRWLKFLQEIFDNDKDLIHFVQKAVGYTLCGSTKEQCFFQCYGDGANGKSVFLNIIYKIIGDYSLNSQVDSILVRKSGTGASNDIARMDGARFVRTNEPNDGARFNEGLVKQLTSGDITTARYLYGNEFEFYPVFKLWIACNYKIIIRGTDYGIQRRQRLIPFQVKFDEKTADKNLETKLDAELPQILGWAVKGFKMYEQEGLESPDSVKEATKDYISEMDTLQHFINQETTPKLMGKEQASDVFNAYKKWAITNNEYCMTGSKFGIELGKRFEKKTIRGKVYYLGFILNEHDLSYVYEKENN